MGNNFAKSFRALTGHEPFPWQETLYQEWFAKGRIPASCNLPTGLGKTAVIAIWLIALTKHPQKMPRRLVYVVNRRTVVDQTTDEAERLQRNAEAAGLPKPAISTLRGQFADNREWSADPSRPAVICGTVDMIGSRLLFSGYGVGFKAKPLHAGFLGQDVLLVHDEAHLEPAFQKLLKQIEEEQQRERGFSGQLPWPNLRVMELTATARGEGKSFELTRDDRKHPEVKRRINAKKELCLHAIADEKKLADELFALALQHQESGRSVLVFVRTVEDVLKVRDKLAKQKLPVEMLTGTLRGKERDGLIAKDVFKRFLPHANLDATDTVYLVCTSAGEVGVNISADHLVCDVSTFDSMAQRFGRVNRFGDRDDTRIDVVHPQDKDFDEKDDLDSRRKKTLELLCQLDGDGSPTALGDLDPAARIAAFAPPPTVLPATDILFDAWALTTIRDKMPGRPEVAFFLHGLPTEWQPPETNVAWREEVGVITDELQSTYEPASLLDDFPLKPHELLREPSYRAFKHFEVIAERSPDTPAWLMDDQGRIEVHAIKNLADKGRKDRIEGRTVILPPSAGGLRSGMLDGTEEHSDDVGYDVADTADRVRMWDDDSVPVGMRLVCEIDTQPNAEDEGEETSGRRFWRWFAKFNEGGRTARQAVAWQVHVDDVVTRTQSIIDKLPLDQPLKDAMILAAKFHDHGKLRKSFQTVLGNMNYPDAPPLAKSGGKGVRLAETYRHEFGSLIDVWEESEFKVLDEDLQELVLHLIAAHHGRGRPHFPADEAFDPERREDEWQRVARETPQRFGRLQRKYGRWGLAYLESLLRAADWAASASPSQEEAS